MQGPRVTVNSKGDKWSSVFHHTKVTQQRVMQVVTPQYQEILTPILQLMPVCECVSVWDRQHTGSSSENSVAIYQYSQSHIFFLE